MDRPAARRSGDVGVERDDGVGEFGADLLREIGGEAGEAPGAVKAPPGGGPLFEFPGLAEGGTQRGRVSGDPGGADIVRLDGPFEMETEFDELAAGLGLKFEVDGGIAVMELEDRPHDAPLGTGKADGEEGHGVVLGEEEELPGLHAYGGGTSH